MNELQKKEFDILLKFDEVCKKLGIKYFLVCGTALGAVKYGGFIPWDDDIDVGLFRPDYEKFLSESQGLLPENIFVQNYRTDVNYPALYCKLRDSNTTYIEKTVKHLDMNHGIYIDVFPLDGYPKNKLFQKLLEIKKKIYKLLLASAFRGEYSSKAKVFFAVERFFGFHKRTAKIANKLDNLISQYDCNNSDLICNHGNWQGKKEYAPKKQYGNGTKAIFENLEVLVPEMYDEYLSQKYGDWKSDLKEEQKIGHHFYCICDLERSYKYYMENR